MEQNPFYGIFRYITQSFLEYIRGLEIVERHAVYTGFLVTLTAENVEDDGLATRRSPMKPSRQDGKGYSPLCYFSRNINTL